MSIFLEPELVSAISEALPPSHRSAAATVSQTIDGD
jgi:hypothetical protein